MKKIGLVALFALLLAGWWYEGYRKDAGWALTDKRTYQNEQYQNQLDAEAIYYHPVFQDSPPEYSKKHPQNK